MEEKLSYELKLACNALIPDEVFLKSQLEEERRFIIDYIGKKYNGIVVDEKDDRAIDKKGYSIETGFNKWFDQRVRFYIEKWEKDTKYNGPIINNYNFLSVTFKILDKFSWFVQNAYQEYSSGKELLNNLDSIAQKIENSSVENRKEIIAKAENIYGKRALIKDWKAVKQTKMDKKDHEKERNLYSLFSEMLVFNEFYENGYEVIVLPETKSKKQPDMLVKKDKETAFVEVKQIHRTFKEDHNLRLYSQYVGFVNRNFRDSLKKKIEDFVHDVSEKFKNVPAKKKEQRILVLYYEGALDAWLTLDNKYCDLHDIFGKSFFDNLGVTNNMNLLIRKSF